MTSSSDRIVRIVGGALVVAGLCAPPRAAIAAPPDPAPEQAPRPAEAPTAGDLATARNALREGLALREQGDLVGALGRFGTAFDLVPTPVTGFELGKTHMRMGHVLQAHELFRKVARMPPALEESTRSATAREEASRLAADLEPRIPTLRLRLKLPPQATATVRVDDEPVTIGEGYAPRAVDPGTHVVVAKAGDGPEQRVTLDIGEGETKDIELAPQWIAPKEPEKTVAPGQVFYLRQTNPLVFVGFGVSAVALTIAGVSAIMLVNAADRVQERCGKDYCSERVRETDLNETGTWALVTGIAGATAIGFFALGVISISRPTNEKVVAGEIRPWVGLGSAGVSGRF